MNPEKILLVVLTLVIISFAGCIATKENEDRQRELELYKTNFDAGPPHPESDFDHDMCYYPLLDYIERTKSLLFTIDFYQGICLFKPQLNPQQWLIPLGYPVTQYESSTYTQYTYHYVAANSIMPYLAINVDIGFSKSDLWVVPFPSGGETIVYSSDEHLRVNREEGDESGSDTLNVMGQNVQTFSWSPDGERLCFIEQKGDGESLRGYLFIWNMEDKKSSQIAQFNLKPSDEPDVTYKPAWDSTGKFIYVVTDGSKIARVEIATGKVENICSGEGVVLFDDDTLIVIRKDTWTPEEAEIVEQDKQFSPYVFFEHRLSTGEEKQILRTASWFGIHNPILSPSHRYLCFRGWFVIRLSDYFKGGIKNTCVFDLETRHWCIIPEIYDWFEPNEAWLEALKKLTETPAKAD